MTSADVIQALIQAKDRGVCCRILLFNDPENQKALKRLTKAKVTVISTTGRTDSPGAKAHEKTLIIDNKIAWTGSFNYTGNAINNNLENMICVSGEQLSLLKDRFEILWQQFNEK